jgi:hypothetical protein
VSTITFFSALEMEEGKRRFAEKCRYSCTVSVAIRSSDCVTYAYTSINKHKKQKKEKKQVSDPRAGKIPRTKTSERDKHMKYSSLLPGQASVLQNRDPLTMQKPKKPWQKIERVSRAYYRSSIAQGVLPVSIEQNFSTVYSVLRQSTCDIQQQHMSSPHQYEKESSR